MSALLNQFRPCHILRSLTSVVGDDSIGGEKDDSDGAVKDVSQMESGRGESKRLVFAPFGCSWVELPIYYTSFVPGAQLSWHTAHHTEERA